MNKIKIKLISVCVIYYVPLKIFNKFTKLAFVLDNDESQEQHRINQIVEKIIGTLRKHQLLTKTFGVPPITKYQTLKNKLQIMALVKIILPQ